MLLNYDISCIVLGSMCVGDLVRLGLLEAQFLGLETAGISAILSSVS